MGVKKLPTAATMVASKWLSHVHPPSALAAAGDIQV
jgi:hypothetical protein